MAGPARPWPFWPRPSPWPRASATCRAVTRCPIWCASRWRRATGRPRRPPWPGPGSRWRASGTAGRGRGGGGGGAAALAGAVAYYRTITYPRDLGGALEDLAVVHAAAGDVVAAKAALREAV